MDNPLRKYRYIILESDESQAVELKNHLSELDHLVFAGEASELQSAIDLTIEQLPDLIFLSFDKEYKRDGLSFSLIPELQRYLRFLPKIVVLSDDASVAADALRYDVFDFIPKPFRRIDIIKAVLKFDRTTESQGFNLPFITKPVIDPEMSEERAPERVANDIEVHDPVPVEREKPLIICVKSYGDYRFINADDICYLKADNNSTDIHLANGEMVTAFKTLKHFENVLVSPFVRIHNSYIVNIDYVSRIHTGNSVCYLKDSGVKLPFSKSYKENVDSILQTITKGNYLEI